MTKMTGEYANLAMESYGPNALNTLIILVLLAALLGCTRKTRVEDSEIQVNPSAQQRYVLTARIQDAPGAFDRFEGSVDYDVSNERCVPLTPFEGATITPSKEIPVQLTRQSDGSFEGTIFLDKLADADYFGLGVCHWAISSASFSAVKGRSHFRVFLSRSDLAAHRESHMYFVGEGYRRLGIDYPSGSRDRSEIKQADDTFSLSISAHEARP